MNCPGSDDGRHTWWRLMRFRWPWGTLFPLVYRCLACGTRGTKADFDRAVSEVATKPVEIVRRYHQ